MFNFDNFRNDHTYFASFALHTKHVGNQPSDVIELIGAFDDVKDIQTFCAAIAKNFALNNEISMGEIKEDTILTVDRGNDQYTVVSYVFETEKDSPLGGIYNTLDIYFTL